MGEKLIKKPSYLEQLRGCAEGLKSRNIDLDVKHIIIVPDRVTLAAEIAVCESLGGAFDVSVMSLNRLFARECPHNAKYLSKQGSILLIKKLVRENSDKLTCFNKSAHRRGFAEKVLGTISMLTRCEIPPSSLNILEGKGADLKLLYSLYLKETEGKYLDVGGRMKLLKNFLNSGNYLTNAHIYICCFDHTTAEERTIFDVMRKKAASVTTYEIEPARRPIKSVQKYLAPSRTLIAKAAVARIAKLLIRGIPADDICVVTEQGKSEEIKRILDENGIPYNAPSPLPLSSHPLGRMIALALTLSNSQGSQSARAVINLSKNPLSGVPKAYSDALERFLTKHNIKYADFLSPFDSRYENDFYFGGANCALSVLRPLLIRGSASLSDVIERLVTYAEKHYTEEMATGDSGRANPFEKASQLSVLADGLLKGLSPSVIIDAFIESLASVELSVMPSMRGVIEIGDESSFRARCYKYVFVLDFDYDTHPHTMRDTSLINDYEISLLRENGIMMSPTTSEVNSLAELEFTLLLEGAEEIFLGYTQKLGSFYAGLEANGILQETETSYDREGQELLRSENAASLLAYCPTRSFLIEQLRLCNAAELEGRIIPSFSGTLKAALGNDINFEDPVQESFVPALKEICFKKEISVSQIECYCSCPLKHFFSYGLKAKTVEMGDIAPIDIGNILHYAADIYVKGNCGDPETVVDGVLQSALAEFTKQTNRECESALVRDLRAETLFLITEINRHFSAGGYTPLKSEYEFGSGSDENFVPVLHTDEREMPLRGKIDRVDVCSDGNLVRVVDYKTGNSGFSLSQIYSGLKLQLMIYLGVMIGQGFCPGGAYYFPVRANWDLDKVILNGITTDSIESLEATEIGSSESRRTTVLSASDAKTKQGEICNLYPLERVQALVDYSFNMARSALEEIEEGYVAASPAKKSECSTRCDYFDACNYIGNGRALPRATLSIKKDKTKGK